MIDWNKKALWTEFYYITLAVSLLSYHRLVGDYIGLAILAKWTLIFVGMTAIMSIFSSSINPLYARDYTGGAFSSAEELNFFRKLGGASYGYASAMVILFPVMIYYYKNSHISIFPKWIILVLILLCYIALIRIQIFANILIASITIIIFYVWQSIYTTFNNSYLIDRDYCTISTK